MIRRVIFVDIDGVLLPFPSNPTGDDEEQRLFPSSTLKPLQRLWNHVTRTNCNDSSSSKNGVEWVLSSTWRVQEKYIRDIERALHEFGIVLQFSDITDPALHSERQWEIQEWLDRHHGCDNNNCQSSSQNLVWLALDDEELLEGDKNTKHRGVFQDHVVCTQSHVGLTEADVDGAIRLWNQQLLEQSK
jgi:hypothetical protein